MSISMAFDAGNLLHEQGSCCFLLVLVSTAYSTCRKQQLYSLFGAAIPQLPAYLVRELNEQHGEVRCEPCISSTTAFGGHVLQLRCSSLPAPSERDQLQQTSQQEGWSPGAGRGAGPGDGQPRGCVRVSAEGVQQTVYQCQRSTAAWQEHGCLTVCIHYAEITMPIHPREGFKEALQMSRWWALPFPLTSLLWQN